MFIANLCEKYTNATRWSVMIVVLIVYLFEQSSGEKSLTEPGKTGGVDGTTYSDSKILDRCVAL